MKALRTVVSCAVFLSIGVNLVSPIHAFHEGGHHLIAVMAFDELSDERHSELLSLLKSHPFYSQDFTPPAGIRDINAWRIGRAGYWADVARAYEDFNRPTWHYQLGATLAIGQVSVPRDPVDAPGGASLQTQELHVVQAIGLCRRVLWDATAPKRDRALALCWLCHLVADIHQPCHAGSLYVAGLFPEGDRGANWIGTVQGENMHALWDSLLGKQFDEGDLSRRREKITRVHQNELPTAAVLREGANQPMLIVKECRRLARLRVYDAEVLKAIRSAPRNEPEFRLRIKLSDNYLKAAGRAAQLQALLAAKRLAIILSEPPPERN
ncbi:MAG: S1/P1 nuclease [Aureliella sp.]